MVGDDDRGATYVLRRLKRYNPELAEQVVAGVLSATTCRDFTLIGVCRTTSRSGRTSCTRASPNSQGEAWQACFGEMNNYNDLLELLPAVLGFGSIIAGAIAGVALGMREPRRRAQRKK